MHVLLAYLYTCLLSWPGAVAQAPGTQPPRPTAAAAPGFITITGRCAVLYRPDDAKIADLKRQGPRADFYTVADDNMFYMAHAETYLRKRGIRVVSTHARQVQFARPGGAPYRIDLSSRTYTWGLLLYDGQHRPRQADIVEPADDVRAVFGALVANRP